MNAVIETASPVTKCGTVAGCPTLGNLAARAVHLSHLIETHDGPACSAHKAIEFVAGERHFTDLDPAQLIADVERWISIIEGNK